MTRQLLLFKLIINYISLDFSSQQISSQIPLSKRYLTFKFQVLYVLISCLHHMLENSNLATSILSLLPDFKKFCFQICSLFCANPALQRALCVRSQFGFFKQSHYELAFNRIYYYRKQGGNPRQPKQTSSAGHKPPGRLNLPASRAGRCPWCCRRHSEHKRLTFCPCGSCGRPPNVKQNAAPYPTSNTNKYPCPSALSPSRRLQAGRSSKSFCFSLLGPTRACAHLGLL